MNAFSPKLAFSPSEAHATAAWFIPGSDVEQWIREIGRWRISMSGVRLYVLPCSLQDLSVAGVLAVTREAAAPECVLRALPYGRLAGKLFLPANAQLVPPVTEDELRQKLPMHTYVLHPSHGLVGFARDDEISIPDLLQPPAPVEGVRWNCAADGLKTTGRLLAVEPDQPPGSDEILQQSRDDIGSRPKPWVPPAPDESSMKQAAQWAALPAFTIVARATAFGASLAKSWAKVRNWGLGKKKAAASPRSAPLVLCNAGVGTKEPPVHSECALARN